MPVAPSFIIEPTGDRFQALIPPVIHGHPLGCHWPRTPDRWGFDKLVQVLVLGATYEKIADSNCSATALRRRRDEWIAAEMFTALEQSCWDADEKMLGLRLEDLAVDGCIAKAPCRGPWEDPRWTAGSRPRSALYWSTGTGSPGGGGCLYGFRQAAKATGGEV